LSVTGLFGYTKAMQKLALNKQSQQVNDFTSGMLTFIKKASTSGALSSEGAIASMVQLGYVPDSIVQTSSTTFMDYTGSRIRLDNFSAGSVELQWSFSTPEQAVNIGQTLQRFSKGINRIDFYNNSWWWGDRPCKNSGYTCFSSLTLSDLQAAASKYQSGGTWRIVFNRR
jgi:hypothetical protein